MKTASLLAVLAILIAIVGAGLSYSGYNESLQTLTVRSTQQFMTASTETVASTRTELLVITTSSKNWILQGETIYLEAVTQAYCGRVDYRYLSLDKGQVHVAYHTDSEYRRVSFWMLNERDFDRWNHLRSCSEMMVFNEGIAVKFNSASYEFTAMIPSSGVYYLAFLNYDKSNSATVTLDIDAGMQQRVLTVTSQHVVRSTQTTEYPTQTVTSATQPAGLGLLFFGGVGLIILAAVVLSLSKRKKTPSATAPVASSTPTVASEGKFCINCGAPLPARATFCNKCGSKQ